MVVIWGRPSDFVNSHEWPDLNWSQCITHCSEDQACVLAYQNGTICRIYNYYLLTTVTQLTESDGDKVAMKGDFPGNQCPVNGNSGNIMTGYLENGGDPWLVVASYNFTLTGSTWKYQFTARTQCYPGTFNDVIVIKENGKQWCIFNFYGSPPRPQGFYQDDAVEWCQMNNAAPFALNTKREFDAIKTMLGRNRTKYVSDATFRLDGKRTDACQATPSSAECMTAQGFTFLDPNFKGSFFANFPWLTDASARNTSDADCLVITAYSNENLTVDVRSCTQWGPGMSMGYFCRREAWSWDA